MTAAPHAISGPALIRARDLSFRHVPERPLLEGVSFDLHAGERVGLAGANGSGKSSLLQLLIGLLPPDGGALELCGQPCRDEADFRPLRGRVGLMFQDADDQLFCPTVQEDIAFGPLNQGLAHAAVRRIVGDMLARLHIVHLAERPVHQLSGGEKRLVALAGVLAMGPEVLLLDEPTTGLDAAAQEKVTEVLLTLPQAMLVVSHDRDFLAQLSTRVIALADGRVVVDSVRQPAQVLSLRR
ncbi:MAG: ABC transporter ATP-binding protein [Methyloversatilis sp.]|jgi:cobalt/nickel transport system ATP-binding protein|nr:ABC transporter ATP-binding protein [Methyloversatilis sp.]